MSIGTHKKKDISRNSDIDFLFEHKKRINGRNHRQTCIVQKTDLDEGSEDVVTLRNIDEPGQSIGLTGWTFEDPQFDTYDT